MLDVQNPVEARKINRDNKYTEQTAGTAYKYVEGNLCILPSKYASDFELFCKKNPKPCPLIGRMLPLYLHLELFELLLCILLFGVFS